MNTGLSNTLPAAETPPAPREARAADAGALEELEALCFKTWLSRRQFRYMLTKAHARTVVSESRSGMLTGYALVLLRRGGSLARLYSIAVHPRYRRRGIGLGLPNAAEEAAAEEGCAYLCLDNEATYRLDRRSG